MIRRPYLFLISMILLIFASGLSVKRMYFSAVAEHVKGTVVEVKGFNRGCGARLVYRCTKFRALVSFEDQSNENHTMVLFEAGVTSGYDAPLSKARVQVGDAVPVVYSPDTPEEAVEDTIRRVYRLPLVFFLCAVGALFYSFKRPK